MLFSRVVSQNNHFLFQKTKRKMKLIKPFKNLFLNHEIDKTIAIIVQLQEPKT